LWFGAQPLLLESQTEENLGQNRFDGVEIEKNGVQLHQMEM
jgi:hypothetical protein